MVLVVGIGGLEYMEELDFLGIGRREDVLENRKIIVVGNIFL